MVTNCGETIVKILNKDVLLPETLLWSVVTTASGCTIYVPFRTEADAIKSDDWLKNEVANM